MIKRVILNVNGISRTVIADPKASLAMVLREQLGLTGVKVGCDAGQCGACSVIMDGRVVRSCITKMARVEDGAQITTIEGIGTPDNLHPLQVAWINYGGVQCGFCSPGFIVSAKVLLDENPAPSRKDVRDWFQKHRNVCRCTGYKPLVDAVMAAAKVLRGEASIEDITAHAQPDKDGKIWNTYYPRPSGVARATGTVDYGADLGLKMPKDTLQLALVQAEVSHAKILSIDTSEAENMPGVVKVLTHKDVKGSNRSFGLIVYPWNKGDGYDRPLLCDEKVFQFGDAIAIVAAESKAQAEAAAQKVKVELELLPAYMNGPDAARDDAIEIHPGTPNVFFECKLKKGDYDRVDEIIASAPYTAEGNYYTQRQPHLSIEPDVGFAYTDEDGTVVIHSKSIALYIHHFMICAGLGLEPDKLRLVMNPQGGNFGYKLSPTLEAFCAIATMATGRPCYLEYSYYQHITYTGKRSPATIYAKAAADENGKLVALKYDAIVDHGPYSEFGDDLTSKVTRYGGGGYYLPTIDAVGRCVFTNHAFGSAFRAFGAPQAEFATNVLMDQLAEACGLDIWEFMNRNVLRPGDTHSTGEQLDVYPLPKLLEMMKPVYEAAKERCAQLSTPEKKRGVGLSVGMYNCGGDTGDEAGSDIELNPDGTVTIFNTWEDPGQGADLGSLVTAHEALRPLGLAPEQIRLVMNDTGLCPDSGPAGASRCQYLVGNAIVDSCRQLLKAMQKTDGSYRTYDEMVAEGIPTRYMGHFTIAPYCSAPDPDTFQFAVRPVPTYQYAIFLAEVEVDIATGKTTVEKLQINADVGVIASRQAVEGQMYGGMSQGVGFALTEDFEDIKKHTNMIACGMPYIKDIPDDFVCEFTETPRPTGPFGACGCGEVPMSSPHAAIINAIYNACGVRITELPARPEKVLAGLKKG
jgi:aldehyde oxidoreductase